MVLSEIAYFADTKYTPDKLVVSADGLRLVLSQSNADYVSLNYFIHQGPGPFDRLTTKYDVHVYE